MRTFTRRCESGDDLELGELPGCFRELFRGPPGVHEAADERAARLAVARDVLAELLDEGNRDDLTLQDAWYALRLGGAELLRGTAAPVREAA